MRRTPITLSQFIVELQKQEKGHGNKHLVSIGLDTRGYFCPRVEEKDGGTECFDVPQYQEMIQE